MLKKLSKFGQKFEEGFSCSIRSFFKVQAPKKALCLLLALLVGAQPALFQMARAHMPGPQAMDGPKALQPDLPVLLKNFSDSDPQKLAKNYFESQIAQYPLWGAFLQSPLEIDRDVLTFDRKSRGLDRDPFFLRAQSWISVETRGLGTNSSSEVEIRYGTSGITLLFEDLPRALHIQVPLRHIITTEEFVFFSLRNPNLFIEASAGQASGAEGIFFIERSEILARAQKVAPLPIFFLPLPGQNWAGEVTAFEFADLGRLGLMNSEEVVSFDLGDLDSLIRLQKMNLVLALVHSALNRREGWNGQILPGMTAAFGLFFSGVDIEKPELSVWPDTSTALNHDHKTALPQEDSLFSLLNKKLESLFQEKDQLLSLLNSTLNLGDIRKGNLGLNHFLGVLGGRNARAEDLSPGKSQSSQASKNRPGYSSQVLWGAAAIGATAAGLGWAHYSGALDRLYALFNVEMFERIRYASGIIGTAFLAGFLAKYTFPPLRKKIEEVRAYRESQGLSQPPQNLAERLGREAKETLDVFAHSMTAMGQFLTLTFTNTLEWVIDRNLPSLGSGDHTLVRKFLNNTLFFARKSIRRVPVNAKTLFLGALVVGGIDTLNMLPQYVYAAPALMLLALPYLNEADQAAVLQSISPDNEQIRSIIVNDIVRNAIAYAIAGASSYSLESRGQIIEQITREVENEFRKRGLSPLDPRQRQEIERLIERRIEVVAKQRGLPGSEEFLFDYNTVWNAVKKLFGFSPAVGQESYLLESRPGLLRPALDLAIQYLSDNQSEKKTPPQVRQEALELLRETRTGVELLPGLLGVNGHFLKHSREVRKQLTLLTSMNAGPSEIPEGKIPEIWSREHSFEAVVLAAQTFRQAIFGLVRPEGVRLLGSTSEQVRQMEELARPEFRPPRYGWLERRRVVRAARVAQKETANLFAQSSDSGEKLLEAERAYYQIFVREIGEQVGWNLGEDRLSADRDAFNELLSHLHSSSEEALIAQLRADPRLKAWIDSLPVEKKYEQLGALYVQHFLVSYKVEMTENERVRSLSSQQPGILQWLRRKPVVQSHPKLMRVVRALESPFDDQEVRLGLRGLIGRSIPGYNDMAASHVRNLKLSLSLLTLAYAWQTLFWGINLPYGAWFLMIVGQAATIMAPSIWLNRALRMQEIKPMGGIWQKVIHSLPYTWITFTGVIPVMLWGPSLDRWFHDHLFGPVGSVLQPIASVVADRPGELVAMTAGIYAVTSPPVRERIKRVPEKIASGLRGAWKRIKSWFGATKTLSFSVSDSMLSTRTGEGLEDRGTSSAAVPVTSIRSCASVNSPTP